MASLPKWEFFWKIQLRHLSFCQKTKNFFWMIFLASLPKWEFFWKIRQHQFLLFQTLQLPKQFQKNLISCFWEKLFIDLPTHWPTGRGIGTILPKDGNPHTDKDTWKKKLYEKEIMVWTRCMIWKQFSLKRLFQKIKSILWRLKVLPGEKFHAWSHEILRISQDLISLSWVKLGKRIKRIRYKAHFFSLTDFLLLK